MASKWYQPCRCSADDGEAVCEKSGKIAVLIAVRPIMARRLKAKTHAASLQLLFQPDERFASPGTHRSYLVAMATLFGAKGFIVWPVHPVLLPALPRFPVFRRPVYSS